MEFDQVIAPVGKDVFLSGYWEKSWLHLPGVAGRFADLPCRVNLWIGHLSDRFLPLAYEPV